MSSIDPADRQMTLHWSPSAPFARKVMMVAIETGLDGAIERVRTPVAPVRPNPVLLAGDNPLSKVPALVLGDGTRLYDSRVICEYLDTLHRSAPLFPSAGPARWQALRRQALADGVSDIVILWRDEHMRGAAASARHIDAMHAKLEAAVDQMNRDVPASGNGPDIGDIATACALSYLDFRVEELAWRTDRHALAAWYATFELRPAAVATRLASDKPV